jgi:prolyl oligopeptidase
MRQDESLSYPDAAELQHMKEIKYSVAIFWIVLSFQSSLLAQKVVYPKTKKVNIVDFYHGHKVFDPYRWLENIDSADVKAWAKKENDLTQEYLDSIPFRDYIKNYLTERCCFKDFFMPSKYGENYFYYSGDSQKNQPVLMMRKTLDSDPVVILDPNLIDTNGTVAVTATAYSCDGKYLAYALSYGGSDRQEIHIKDIAAGKDYDEVLPWCKFVNIAWDSQDRGFYYNGCTNPGISFNKDRYNYSRIYWHTLGTPHSQDSIAFEMLEDKGTDLMPFASDDGRYLLIYAYNRDDEKVDIYYLDTSTGGFPVQLIKDENTYYSFIGYQGTQFYFITGLKSPTGKVIAIDLNNPSKKKWREIIPAGNEVIDFVNMVNNQLAVVSMYSVHHIIKIYDLDGKFIRELELPTIGTISNFSGRQNDSQMFLTFQSFIFPPTVFYYDFNTNEFRQFYKPQFDFDFSQYITRQVYFKSDLIMVPMFITYRKDLPADGNNPTLLYGYGGFGVSMEPSFSASTLLWLEGGGVYAVANIRGGGEFGWIWHQGGMGPRKQNSFDDFTEAAKWLIDGKITSPSKLAIWGGSNGGLLVAACMEQHPDLFGAVVCQVPITDMLRYQKFTVGSNWTDEYGNSDKDDYAFRWLRAYSPLHNVSLWSEYPPVLVTTGENDDRVPPLHAYKFVAALQEHDKGEKPKLLRIESDAGHGRGEPLAKTIEEKADLYAFLFHTFGMTPKGWQDNNQK